MIIGVVLQSLLFYQVYTQDLDSLDKNLCICKGMQTQNKFQVCERGSCSVDHDTNRCQGDYRLYTTEDSSIYHCFNPNTTSRSATYNYRTNIVRKLLMLINSREVFSVDIIKNYLLTDVFHPECGLTLGARTLLSSKTLIGASNVVRGIYKIAFSNIPVSSSVDYKTDFSLPTTNPLNFWKHFFRSDFQREFRGTVYAITPIALSQPTDDDDDDDDDNDNELSNLTLNYNIIVEFDTHSRIIDINIHQRIQADARLFFTLEFSEENEIIIFFLIMIFVAVAYIWGCLTYSCYNGLCDIYQFIIDYLNGGGGGIVIANAGGIGAAAL